MLKIDQDMILDTVFDSRKILRKLKWRPTTKLFKGLEVTIDWYLKNKNLYPLFLKNFMIKD